MPSLNDKALQKEYSKLLKDVATDVPKLPGWYLWGRFNDMGWWETVYLGKAGKGITSSLYTRLYDEMREECIAFWSQVYGREPMLKQQNKLYDGRWDPTRSLRKIGSQMVIWVAVDDPISESEIKRQEDFLIKLYRPTHNAARWNLSAAHDDFTEQIEKSIEDELRNIIVKL